MPDIPNRDELEGKIGRLLGNFNQKQKGKLLEMMGNSPSMAKIPPSFWEDAKQALAEELISFSQEVFLQAAQRILDDVPVGVDWSLVNQNAADWAVRDVGRLVRDITETTRKRVGGAVSSYFTEAETIGDLEKRLSRMHDRFGGIFGPKRAEGIAITEITRAAAEGERATVRELKREGVELFEIWQTNKDELVCQICGPRHGKVEGSNWTRYQGPPAHPRCRCWVNHDLEKPIITPQPEAIGGIQPSTGAYSDEEWEEISDWYVRGEDVNDWDDKVRAKDTIVRDISERSGLDYEDANDMVGTWANTSNDDNVDALHLQQRASEIFGIEPSDWQLSKMGKYKDLEHVSLWTNDEVDRFLNAMYDNTQEQFRAAGIDNVKLLRGIQLDQNDLMAMKDAGINIDDLIAMKQNVMESWTLNQPTAEDFGNLIIETDVPVDRIIGSARTGFGCLDEYEFIVMGSDADEYATIINILDIGY